MHRSKRADPTTRSWIPLRTFLAQVRFLRPGEKSPRPGPSTPPSGPEKAGQKGQKSRPPGQLSGRPGGPPAARRQHRRKRHGSREKPGPPAGRETGPETIRNHGSGSPATLKTPLKITRHTSAPARQTVSPARAEDPVQDLQPAPGARRRTLPQRRGPSQDPAAGGSHTPSRGREKGNVPASPRFADQLREEESNSQQPAPPEGRSSESSDQ